MSRARELRDRSDHERAVVKAFGPGPWTCATPGCGTRLFDAGRLKLSDGQPCCSLCGKYKSMRRAAA